MTTKAGHNPRKHPRSPYVLESVDRLGTVELATDGQAELTLKAVTINQKAPEGLSVSDVILTPV